MFSFAERTIWNFTHIRFEELQLTPLWWASPKVGGTHRYCFIVGGPAVVQADTTEHCNTGKFETSSWAAFRRARKWWCMVGSRRTRASEPTSRNFPSSSRAMCAPFLR